MLTDLLWFLGAKQQHDMQKGQGLAGLTGLLLVIFMVWKWDELFYPLFDKLGLVAMAGRVGLIHEELSVMTVINVLAMIFLLAVFFAIGLAVVFIVQYLLFIPLMIILLPFKLIHMMYFKKSTDERDSSFASPEQAYKQNNDLKQLIAKYKNEKYNVKMFRYYQEQINRSEETDGTTMYYGKEKIKPFLQRAVASIKDDREWLISYNIDTEKWYILFPNPLPEFASSAFMSDYSQTNKSLYDFNRLGTARIFHTPEYVVPGLPISFEWTGHEVSPKLAKGNPAIEKFTVTEGTIAYRFNTKSMSTLFENVAQLKQVQRAIKESHLAIYLIPLANPVNQLSTDTQDFLNELATIPSTDAFAPIYAADVQERMIHYAESGKEFAINWLKSSV